MGDAFLGDSAHSHSVVTALLSWDVAILQSQCVDMLTVCFSFLPYCTGSCFLIDFKQV